MKMLDKNHNMYKNIILVISTVTITTGVTEFLVIQSLEANISFLTNQNSLSQQKITNFESTAADIKSEINKEATEKISGYKEICVTKEKILNFRIEELEKSISTYKFNKNTVKIKSEEMCNSYKKILPHISLLKKQEISAANDLSILHEELYEMKSSYQQNQAECENSNVVYICGVARSKKGKVEALEAEIETNRTYLAKISEQLLEFKFK